MNKACESLNRLMRAELTATNQQFTHVLALRAWGDEETAARIMEVDYVDFPNAMRIIDHLVEAELPVELPPDPYTPGTGLASMLRAELAVEGRINEAIETAADLDERGRAFVAAAEAPRAAYGAWLRDRLSRAHSGEGAAPPDDAEIADLLGHLITMIEQPLVHAFVHRHQGEPRTADAAWATSGAAMVQATQFVRLYAAEKTVPAPGPIPAPRIARQSDEAVDCDRRLAEDCAEVAAQAARASRQDAAAQLCSTIADYCRALADWEPGRPHPAADSNPPAFASFEATLTRFVRPR